MTNKTKLHLDRRQLVAGTAAVTAATALGMPHIARAADAIKIGLIHPVTGFLQFSGSQCRFGAQLAIDELNKAGGIKSMGGAMLEAVPRRHRPVPPGTAAHFQPIEPSGHAKPIEKARGDRSAPRVAQL